MASKLCVYCGVRVGIEAEDVVARAHFAGGPGNRVLVPSCKDCNSLQGDGGTENLSVAEEKMMLYLRLQLPLEHPDDPERKLIDKAIRAMEKNRVLGLFLAAPAFPAPPIDLSDKTFPMERVTIQRVIGKIARGIHFHLWNERLTHSIPVYVDDEVPLAEVKAVISSAPESAIVKIGRGTEFKCCATRNERGAIFYILFFDLLPFKAGAGYPSTER